MCPRFTDCTADTPAAWPGPPAGGASVYAEGSVLEKSVVQTPRQAARVFDEEDNDVTPLPLYQADPGSVQAIGSRSVLSSSRISSQSTTESMNEEIEDTFYKRDMASTSQDVQGKRDSDMTEEMLRTFVDIYISETDTISLLDIPSILVSVDADNAEHDCQHLGMYNTLSNPEPDDTVQRPEPEQRDCPDVDTSRAAERSTRQCGEAWTLEQRDEDTESCKSPRLEHLWSFSCELTRGRRVSCMAWNMKYQCCDSLDFSANSPRQLAVGLHDGTINIYNVRVKSRSMSVPTSTWDQVAAQNSSLYLVGTREGLILKCSCQNLSTSGDFQETLCESSE
ncbi:hypothetical protein INR49_000625 [Caranx melampygus]|nr:hypothetical protein INR49_000625 [Caranx melampygus]